MSVMVDNCEQEPLYNGADSQGQSGANSESRKALASPALSTSSICSDDALMEMLGLSELVLTEDVEDAQTSDIDDLNQLPEWLIKELRDDYSSRSIVALSKPSISHLLPTAETIRLLADEVIYSADKRGDRTYETIKVMAADTGIVSHRKCITRIENFVHLHEGWSGLVGDDGAIATVVNQIIPSSTFFSFAMISLVSVSSWNIS